MASAASTRDREGDGGGGGGDGTTRGQNSSGRVGERRLPAGQVQAGQRRVTRAQTSGQQQQQQHPPQPVTLSTPKRVPLRSARLVLDSQSRSVSPLNPLEATSNPPDALALPVPSPIADS